MNKHLELAGVIEKLAFFKKEINEAVIKYRDLEAEKLATKIDILGCIYVYTYQFNSDDGFLATALVLANKDKVLKHFAIIVEGEDYDSENLFNEDEELNELKKDSSLYKRLEELYFNDIISSEMTYLEDYIIYC